GVFHVHHAVSRIGGRTPVVFHRYIREVICASPRGVWVYFYEVN
ncbi:unnamed protein product, partial [Ixodes pacificus]